MSGTIHPEEPTPGVVHEASLTLAPALAPALARALALTLPLPLN